MGLNCESPAVKATSTNRSRPLRTASTKVWTPSQSTSSTSRPLGQPWKKPRPLVSRWSACTAPLKAASPRWVSMSYTPATKSGSTVWGCSRKPHAGVTVVAMEPTDWQPEKAVAAMENWLVAYPELDLVYGNSDGLTVPAAQAAQAAGNTDILFTSVDGSDFALEAIKNGVLKSTFMYAPEYSGFWKAWVPFKAAMGEQKPEY